MQVKDAFTLYGDKFIEQHEADFLLQHFQSLNPVSQRLILKGLYDRDERIARSLSDLAELNDMIEERREYCEHSEDWTEFVECQMQLEALAKAG